MKFISLPSSIKLLVIVLFVQLHSISSQAQDLELQQKVRTALEVWDFLSNNVTIGTMTEKNDNGQTVATGSITAFDQTAKLEVTFGSAEETKRIAIIYPEFVKISSDYLRPLTGNKIENILPNGLGAELKYERFEFDFANKTIAAARLKAKTAVWLPFGKEEGKEAVEVQNAELSFAILDPLLPQKGIEVGIKSTLNLPKKLASKINIGETSYTSIGYINTLTKEMSIGAELSSEGIPIYIESEPPPNSVPDTIVLMRGAKLELYVENGTAGLSIGGQVEIRPPAQEEPLFLDGEFAIDIDGQVFGQGWLTGYWKNPFNINESLYLTNAGFGFGIDAKTTPIPMPIFALEAGLSVGDIDSTKARFAGKATVAFHGADPTQNMVDGFITKANLFDVVDAFTPKLKVAPFDQIKLPPHLKSLFKTIYLRNTRLTIVPPGPGIDIFGHKYEPGVLVQGIVDIDQFTGAMLISINENEIAAYAGMSPIKYPELDFEFTASSDNTKGPEAFINVTRQNPLDGFMQLDGRVKLLGMSAKADVYLSDAGFNMDVEGKIFNEFNTKLEVAGADLFSADGGMYVNAELKRPNDLGKRISGVLNDEIDKLENDIILNEQEIQRLKELLEPVQAELDNLTTQLGQSADVFCANFDENKINQLTARISEIKSTLFKKAYYGGFGPFLGLCGTTPGYFDVGGECWTCPSGYSRVITVPYTSTQACVLADVGQRTPLEAEHKAKIAERATLEIGTLVCSKWKEANDLLKKITNLEAAIRVINDNNKNLLSFTRWSTNNLGQLTDIVQVNSAEFEGCLNTINGGKVAMAIQGSVAGQPLNGKFAINIKSPGADIAALANTLLNTRFPTTNFNNGSCTKPVVPRPDISETAIAVFKEEIKKNPNKQRVSIPEIEKRPSRNTIILPGILEAEKWRNVDGMFVENTSDGGGGQNIVSSRSGDFAEYRVIGITQGDYIIHARTATFDGGNKFFELQLGTKTVDFSITGAPNEWNTISKRITIDNASDYLKLTANSPGLKINRFTFVKVPEVNNTIPVQGIVLSSTFLETQPREESSLTATIQPSNATNQQIVWSSSDDGVVYISEDGKTLISITTGTAIITAKSVDGGFEATCNINVTDTKPPIVFIRDANFKDALLANDEINTNQDAQIQVSEARAFTGEINVSGLGISNLSGIEAFTSLTKLNCSNNSLTALYLSRNSALQSVNCSLNNLTKLDISNNRALETLTCSSNQLTALDVSKTSVKYLFCDNNQFIALDLSRASSLINVTANSNTQLSFLNLANGNNGAVTAASFTGNVNLFCINVDNGFAPPASWRKDASASFNGNCAVYIPDAIFKNILISNTAINTNGNSEIEFSEARAYTGEIKVFTREIQSLLGIEAFTSITSLDCSSNDLRTLDVSQNIQLKKLNCRSNFIAELDISKNIYLEELNCLGNRALFRLDVSNNPYLKSILASFTKIREINTTSNESLESLAISSTEITSLDVSENTKLKYLYCSGNELTALDITKNIELIELNCRFNKLTSLNLSNGNNAVLEALDASNNQDLTCIKIDNNFTPPASWNKDNTAIYDPYCGNPVVFIPDANFKQALLNNSGININNDNDIQISEAESFTGTLDVSSLGIADLTGIEAFKNITYLECSNNELTSLDVFDNVGLVSLSCSNNKLTTLDISNNTSLVYFYANNNLLEQLNTSQNTALLFLVAEENILTELNLRNNTQLEWLLVPDNQLTDLDVSANTSLSVLNCSKNNLTSLSIANNRILTELDCKDNQLNTLNIANGGTNQFLRFFNSTGNTDLVCIQTDSNFVLPDKNWFKDAISTFSTGCTAVNIPDANFKKALVENRAINGNGDTEIQFFEALNYTGIIDVNSLNISDLTGIEAFTKIRQLNCDFNNLTALDVSQNTALVRLSCNVNNLSFLDVSNNTELQVLSCGANQLTALDVSENLKLEELYAYENKLSTIDTRPLNFLKSLWVGDNQLSELDVSQNNLLVALLCDKNQLNSLSLSNNTALERLLGSANRLTELFLNNGNNEILTEVDVTDNLLDCIPIDADFTAPTTWKKDDTAQFGSDCLPVYIPNANFKRALVDNTDINSNGDEEIQIREAEAYTSEIDVSSLGIDDLTGIEAFVNITELNCDFNQLISLNVAENRMLVRLKCNNNSINAIDVSRNTDLIVLDIGANNVSTIDISQNTELVEFYAYSNQLTEISLNSLPKLKSLWLGDNQLTTLDVSNNIALTNLLCDKNNLGSLSLTENIALEQVICNDNQLVDLRLDNGRNQLINEVNAINNLLNCIPTDSGFNAPATWQKDATAEFGLDCSAVYIPDASFKSALVENTEINTNGDTEIQVREAKAYTGSIEVSNLGIVDLTGIEAFTNLTFLDCSFNILTNLDVTANTALTTLACANNWLSNLDINNNTELEQLYCNNNSLSSLNTSSNTKLWFLVSAENDLTDLDLSSNIELEWLISDNNALASLDVSRNEKLSVLNLSNNDLTRLSIANNRILTDLNCSDNRLIALNIANGGQNQFLKFFNAINNPNLACINVDKDFVLPEENWRKDVFANFSVNCEEAVVNIPDVNFKEALLRNTAINANEDDEIQFSEASSYTGAINISSNNIADLTGISAFTEITELNCNYNELKVLDVSENTQLIKLSCIENSLTALDLNNNVNLVILEIADNQLTEIDLSANISLEVFYAFENQFTQLDLANQPLLKKLWISDNQLTSLDISKNIILETLNSNNNQLGSLDISTNTVLSVLSSTSNNLTSLNLLNGNNDAITTMTVTNNPNLTCIQIDEGFTPPNTWAKDATGNYSTDCNVTTSINKALSASFDVYPNPVNHTLYIENIHNSIEIIKLDIYDLQGRLVSSSNNPRGFQIEIDASFLKSGLYLLKIRTDEGIAARRFLKN